MKIGLTYYELYDPKAKLYLLLWPSNTASNWVHDPDWKPRWVTEDDLFRESPGLPKAAAENKWLVYEFQRTEYRPDLPELEIREITYRAAAITTGVAVKLTPMFRMIQRVRAKHGDSLLTFCLEFLQTDKQPMWAIRRKVKISDDVLPDTILHSGKYMFFYNREDIVLAKIALGPNIVKEEYDLREFV